MSEESSDENMFEHPEALKLSLIAAFYENRSKYDFRRILQQLIALTRLLELPLPDKLQEAAPAHTSKKFTVVSFGQHTRVADKIIPAHPSPESNKLPFIVH